MARTSFLDNCKKLPYYFGSITRADAEQILMQFKVDGAFLIRESTNYAGHLTLDVKFESSVQHYKIEVDQANNQCFVDEDSRFSSLAKLIEFYSDGSHGMCCQLTQPLQRGLCAPADLATPAFDQRPPDPLAHLDAFRQQGLHIDYAALNFQQQIGKGECSVVYAGVWCDQTVALKVLNSAQHSQDFLREAHLSLAHRHDNIVRCFGISMHDARQEFVLIYEYMAGGSLLNYLRSRGRGLIKLDQQLAFACNVANGMSYLESQNLVHRDLAARNILLDDRCVAKIADFGLAQPLNNNADQHKKLPIKWTAPEALSKGLFTSRSDVWSYGVLLWEIFSFGRVPYPRIAIGDVQAVVENGYRMEAPDTCPPELYSLMQATWKPTPAERPSFRDILRTLAEFKPPAVVPTASY